MIPRHLKIGVTVLLAAVLGLGGYVFALEATRGAPSRRSGTGARRASSNGSQRTSNTVRCVRRSGILVARGASIPLPQGRQERAQEVLQALLARYLQEDSSHPLPAGFRNSERVFGRSRNGVIDANSGIGRSAPLGGLGRRTHCDFAGTDAFRERAGHQPREDSGRWQGARNAGRPC